MQDAVSGAVDWVALVDTIFKLALIPIAVAAVVYLAKLLGFKLSVQQTADLEQAVKTGLLQAEERGIQAWKNHQTVISGQEKLAMAVTTARELSPDGLVKYSDDQLAKRAEAELVLLRPLISSPPPPMGSSLPPPILSSRPPAG